MSLYKIHRKHHPKSHIKCSNDHDQVRLERKRGPTAQLQDQREAERPPIQTEAPRKGPPSWVEAEWKQRENKREQQSQR